MTFEIGDIVRYVNDSHDLGTTPASCLTLGKCYRVRRISDRSTVSGLSIRVEVDELTGNRLEAWPLATRFEKI